MINNTSSKTPFPLRADEIKRKMPFILKTTGLSYHYAKDAQTLFDIDLQIERGSIYGFLGPNGSGKTTTLSLVLGLLENQKGSIEIFGQHLQTNRGRILKKIGALIEAPSLYGHLTAKENLEVFREIYGASKSKTREVLDIVGLPDTGKKLVKKFSLGMKQRLAIALALLPDPELLILDEPSNGLDPAGIIELRELIRQLNKTHGMTIVISSHLLSEVEKLVSHIGIIFKGKMLFQGPLSGLHALQEKGARLLISTSNNDAAMQLLYEFNPQQERDTLLVPLQDQQQGVLIQKLLAENNIDIYLLQPKKNDLEQIFIDLTTSPS